jgi:hypothetical protein
MSSDIEKAKDLQADPQTVPVTATKARARRGFLLGAGAAAGVAGATAMALGRSAQVATPQAAEPVAQDDAPGKGYHVTAHIRKYYDTTKV